MAELNIEAVIKSGVEKALNKPIVDGKSITEWAAIGMKAPRWVSVKNRLPKENTAVNIIWKNIEPVSYYEHIKGKPFVATGVYFRGKWYWWSSVVQDYLMEYGNFEPDGMDKAITVTHWMPLPEPPKEERDDS